MTRPKTPGRVVPIEDKKPGGRPRKLAPPDAAEVIRAATATGASKVGTAMALAVSVDVLNRWLDESPALAEAFAQGREKERQTLHNVLYTVATKANADKDSLIASMFLLKARHGYQEGQQENQSNKVSITFNLPGALQPEQFTIENGRDRNTANIALSKPNLERS